MEWLTQNWIWLVLAVGVAWMFFRGRQGGSMGCCSTHDMAHKGSAGKSEPQGAEINARPSVKEERAG